MTTTATSEGSVQTTEPTQTNPTTLTLATVLQLPAGSELDAIVEGVVFGDDLKWHGDEGALATILRTVTKKLRFGEYEYLEWNQTKYFSIYETEKAAGTYCKSWHWHVWENRHGKPYQPDLERAVEAWRREPRPFSSDGNAMLELIEASRSRSFQFDIRCGSLVMSEPFAVGAALDIDDEEYTFYSADTLPLAVCRAAVAALWNRTSQRSVEKGK